jgi:3-oxoadipate enol-lactonase
MPILPVKNAQIYYEQLGNGPTIVFAHGAGGNAAIWFNQMAHFATDYQCVAFDHRCFARSPCPSGKITVQDFRDDLLAIMDTLDIEQAHLVGQSMGGFTVLRTALDAPDRVSSLTLSCTSGGIKNPNPTPAMRNLTQATGNDSSGVKATMAQATFRKPALIALYEAINNFNTEFSWDKLKNLLGREDVVTFEHLAQVQCPTLFIAGAEDPLFPAALLESFVPHFKDAQIEVIQDAGHSPYFEQPELFNQRLQQHLQYATNR